MLFQIIVVKIQYLNSALPSTLPQLELYQLKRCNISDLHNVAGAPPRSSRIGVSSKLFDEYTLLVMFYFAKFLQFKPQQDNGSGCGRSSALHAAS